MQSTTANHNGDSIIIWLEIDRCMNVLSSEMPVMENLIRIPGVGA